MKLWKHGVFTGGLGIPTVFLCQFSSFANFSISIVCFGPLALQGFGAQNYSCKAYLPRGQIRTMGHEVVQI